MHAKETDLFVCHFFFSFEFFYATLYVKLIWPIFDFVLELLLPGRIGESNLTIKASASGGDTFPRIYSRHICTEAEKFALYEYFLSFFSKTMCEIVSSEKLYIINRA